MQNLKTIPIHCNADVGSEYSVVHRSHKHNKFSYCYIRDSYPDLSKLNKLAKWIFQNIIRPGNNLDSPPLQPNLNLMFLFNDADYFRYQNRKFTRYWGQRLFNTKAQYEKAVQNEINSRMMEHTAKMRRIYPWRLPNFRKEDNDVSYWNGLANKIIKDKPISVLCGSKYYVLDPIIKVYKLEWKEGIKEILPGESIAHALFHAGYRTDSIDKLVSYSKIT